MTKFKRVNGKLVNVKHEPEKQSSLSQAQREKLKQVMEGPAGSLTLGTYPSGGGHNMPTPNPTAFIQYNCDTGTTVQGSWSQ